MRVGKVIAKLARTFDEQRKRTAPIRVYHTRRYLMTQGCHPQRRGGPLFYGDHPILQTVLPKETHDDNDQAHL